MNQKIKHWQDPVNVVLGLGFALSPWIAGYADISLAMWSAVAAGLALAAAALGAVFVPKAWAEWTQTVISVWMILSPWLLSFADERSATAAAVGTGVVALALALSRLLTDKELGVWRGGRSTA